MVQAGLKFLVLSQLGEKDAPPPPTPDYCWKFYFQTIKKQIIIIIIFAIYTNNRASQVALVVKVLA